MNTYNPYWQEKELSTKDYNVQAMNYMNTGVLRVCIEKGGKFYEAADYPDRYGSVADCKRAIIEKALNNKPL